MKKIIVIIIFLFVLIGCEDKETKECEEDKCKVNMTINVHELAC